MKTMAAAFLICASILAIHFAVGAAGTDRPAGYCGAKLDPNNLEDYNLPCLTNPWEGAL